MSVFGFSTAPSTGGGDFTPIVKYDARAGRVFRIDREDNGNGFENEPIDITGEFKAIFDFENVEVGWIDFVAGSPPDFKLVKMGQPLPPKPGDRHKNGIRFMIKLAKDCGGSKPIREIAGTSKVFLAGVEAAYKAYEAERANNPGKLPVFSLERTLPIKSGSGERSSTNYQPIFKLVSWAPRGDLQPQLKTTNGSGAQAAPATPPSTGSTRVEPPKQKVATTSADDDFG